MRPFAASTVAAQTVLCLAVTSMLHVCIHGSASPTVASASWSDTVGRSAAGYVATSASRKTVIPPKEPFTMSTWRDALDGSRVARRSTSGSSSGGHGGSSKPHQSSSGSTSHSASGSSHTSTTTTASRTSDSTVATYTTGANTTSTTGHSTTSSSTASPVQMDTNSKGKVNVTLAHMPYNQSMCLTTSQVMSGSVLNVTWISKGKYSNTVYTKSAVDGFNAWTAGMQTQPGTAGQRLSHFRPLHSSTTMNDDKEGYDAMWQLTYQRQVFQYEKAIIFTVIVRDETLNASVAMWDTKPIYIVARCKAKQDLEEEQQKQKQKSQNQTATGTEMTSSSDAGGSQTDATSASASASASASTSSSAAAPMTATPRSAVAIAILVALSWMLLAQSGIR